MMNLRPVEENMHTYSMGARIGRAPSRRPRSLEINRGSFRQGRQQRPLTGVGAMISRTRRRACVYREHIRTINSPAGLQTALRADELSGATATSTATLLYESELWRLIIRGGGRDWCSGAMETGSRDRASGGVDARELGEFGICGGCGGGLGAAGSQSESRLS